MNVSIYLSIYKWDITSCFICIIWLPSWKWIWDRDGICLRKWKPICLPKFDEISQSTAEMTLLPVSENWHNGQPPYSNCNFGFDSDVCAVIGMSFYTKMPITILTSISEIEFQYSGRPFSETVSSFISAVNSDISSTFYNLAGG